MATQTLPDGLKLGQAIKQRFETLEARILKVETEIKTGFDQVFANEQKMTNAIAALGHQKKPFN